MSLNNNSSRPSQILPFLFLGGRDNAKAKSVLQSMKIKYIINCTPSKAADPDSGCPNFFEKEKLFKYLRVPLYDNKGEDFRVYMDSVHRFIEEGKHYGGVLVHCHKGISRSSTFVLSYLMRYNDFTLDEAISYVKSIRPIVAPNDSFLAQLQAYEVQLNAREIVSSSSLHSESITTVGKLEIIGPSIGPSFPLEVSSSEDNRATSSSSQERLIMPMADVMLQKSDNDGTSTQILEKLEPNTKRQKLDG